MIKKILPPIFNDFDLNNFERIFLGGEHYY